MVSSFFPTRSVLVPVLIEMTARAANGEIFSTVVAIGVIMMIISAVSSRIA